MTVYGGAARDLLRNLPAITEHFEVKFLCLNLRDSQRTLIESMGVEVLCPEEQWEAEGSLDCAMRANLKWKEMLKEYEAPKLDPAIDEALLEFIAKRKSEFEDRDY